MDVINILINPSEKAKCGHGAMLTTVPPGAAAGGRPGSTRRPDGGGPGPLAKWDFCMYVSFAPAFLES